MRPNPSRTLADPQVPEGMSLLDEMGGGGQSLFDELENDETQPEARPAPPSPCSALCSLSVLRSVLPALSSALLSLSPARSRWVQQPRGWVLKCRAGSGSGSGAGD